MLHIIWLGTINWRTVMKTFNPLEENIDIYTNTLLEASAGTGKTFSIENIFVRLLLENNPYLNSPLKIENVLVVTFTRAATADLKHRIRKNIEIIPTSSNGIVKGI